MKLKKLLTISCCILTIILIIGNTSAYIIQTTEEKERHKQIFEVPTPDKQLITLTRYVGDKPIPIILIHGMGGNHLMYDWDESHSLPRYLNDEGWDVWLLDLRTCDGDGDYFLVKGSDREYINRYWDFDRTLLKIDVVTAVDFVKKVTLRDQIFLGGHSYGGYLAYAYAMMIGEENLSGIITTGASPYANRTALFPKKLEMLQYGFYLGKRAFVNPLGKPWTFTPKIKHDIFLYLYWDPEDSNAVFYKTTTPEYIQKEIGYHGDSQPAGVWVDMFFGKDPKKYGGHWVDPQTLYDYSENLDKITVPILFIAGDNDTQDPWEGIYSAYENVSSEMKEFYSFPEHSHLDLLLGDNASKLIFPKISCFMEKVLADIED